MSQDTQLNRLKRAVWAVVHNPMTPKMVKDSILDDCDYADFTPTEDIEYITYPEGVQVMDNGD